MLICCGQIGLYSGLLPALATVAPQMGANYLVYESLSELMRTNTDTRNVLSQWTKAFSNHNDDGLAGLNALPLWAVGLAGGVSGGVSKLLVYPLVSSFSVILLFLHFIRHLALFQIFLLLLVLSWNVTGHYQETNAGSDFAKHDCR